MQQNEGSIRAWESIFCLVAKTGITALWVQQHWLYRMQIRTLLLLRTLSVSLLAYSTANAHATVCPWLPLLVHCVTGVCLHFHTDVHPSLKISGLLLVSAYLRISHLWLPQATSVLIKQTDSVAMCMSKSWSHWCILLLFWSDSLTSKTGCSWEVAQARDDSQVTMGGYFGV